jgi:hypothetical protein
MLYNFVQIKCEECSETSSFLPGKNYDRIECPICKKEKEEKANESKRKRSTKSTKKV